MSDSEVRVGMAAVVLTYDRQRPEDPTVIPNSPHADRSLLGHSNILAKLLAGRKFGDTLGEAAAIEVDGLIRSQLIAMRRLNASNIANEIVGYYQKLSNRLVS